MAKWTIEEARDELAYCTKLCADGGNASVPNPLVYGYVTGQARMIARAGEGREDFREVADALQDLGTAFLVREVELSKAADEAMV